jgi:acetyl esterase/lipase
MQLFLTCLIILVLQLVSCAQENIAYSQRNNTNLLLDVYGASKGDKKPVILCIHGGGWEFGNKRQVSGIAKQFTKQGYATICINYRLTSNKKNVWPAQIIDVQTSVRWIRENAKTYGFDPDRIVAFGVSAGGHLANLLGTMETYDHSNKELAQYSSRVNAVISYAGPTNLVIDFDSISYTGGRNVQQLVDQLLGKTYKENRKKAREASPIFHISDQTVPHLLVHGVKDKIVSIEQSRSYYSALKNAKIPCEMLELELEGHRIKNKLSFLKILMKTNEFLRQQKMIPAAPNTSLK